MKYQTSKYVEDLKIRLLELMCEHEKLSESYMLAVGYLTHLLGGSIVIKRKDYETAHEMISHVNMNWDEEIDEFHVDIYYKGPINQ